MRKSILPLAVSLLASGACTADRPSGHVVIEDFIRRATPVRCRPADPGIELAVTELRLVSDTSFLVLDEAQRQVAVLDQELRLLWRVSYPEAGPASAEGAISAAVLGDSAVAIAARHPLRIVVLSRAGELRRSVPLDFVPNSIEATSDGGLLITPMPLGARPGSLLLRYDGSGVRELGLPLRPYDDMMIRALGNAALVETLPDGGALVVHQFLAPRAFRISRDGAVSGVPVPTPDASLESVGFVPRAPITEPQMLRMAVPAMALNVDPDRGDVYLMTRSGRLRDGRPERAILHLDPGLAFLDAYLLDAPASRMVYLPRRKTALVADDEDRFHACSLAPLSTAAEGP